MTVVAVVNEATVVNGIVVDADVIPLKEIAVVDVIGDIF